MMYDLGLNKLDRIIIEFNVRNTFLSRITFVLHSIGKKVLYSHNRSS